MLVLEIEIDCERRYDGEGISECNMKKDRTCMFIGLSSVWWNLFGKADSGEQAETLWNMLSRCRKESFPQTSILTVTLLHRHVTSSRKNVSTTQSMMTYDDDAFAKLTS